MRAPASSPPPRGPRGPGTRPATSRSPSTLADGRDASALCVETRDGLHGHLVCARPPAALDDDALEALDQARRFLAVELDRQEELHRERVRFASELIDLVEAGEARPVETAARLERFGLRARVRE